MDFWRWLKYFCDVCKNQPADVNVLVKQALDNKYNKYNANYECELNNKFLKKKLINIGERYLYIHRLADVEKCTNLKLNKSKMYL